MRKGKSGVEHLAHHPGWRTRPVSTKDSFTFTLGEGMGGLAAFNPDVLLAKFNPGDIVKVTIEKKGG